MGVDITFHVQGGKIIRAIQRAERGVIEALAAIPTSILSDCLDRLNVLDPGLRPLSPPRRFAGSAFTVEEIEAGNLMSHLALQYVQPGDVLVIDAKGVTTRACWGGLQTFAAKRKGVTAIIIDGAVRDAEEAIKHDIPLYCKAVTPAGPHKGWGGRVNQPIACGSTVVQPGDVIVADGDGLVAVPRELAAQTLEKARAKRGLESQWFQKVAEGVDTAVFLGFVEVARKYGIEVV
jgi:regulator of RNase E activity RraA